MNGEDEPREDASRDRRVTSADIQRADRGLGTGVGSLEYCPDEDAHRAFYDARTVRPSTLLLTVISAVEGTDPLDLDPMHSAIDLDALDMLLGKRAGPQGGLLVTFLVEGHDVTISSHGTISVRSTEPAEGVGRYED